MRAVIQLISEASVETGGETIAKVGKGLLVLIGLEKGDHHLDVEYLVEKIVNLRIFPDKNNRMNISLLEIQGELLVVSQFTLLGDLRKGRRPNFDQAMRPENAEDLYEYFIKKCKEHSVKTKSGRFRTSMNVNLTNTGPVTLLLSSRKEF